LDEKLARFDLLIISYRYGADVTGDSGGYGNKIAVNLSVVSGDFSSPHQPVDEPSQNENNEDCYYDEFASVVRGRLRLDLVVQCEYYLSSLCPKYNVRRGRRSTR
jgi:hypothetical protein